MMRSCKCFPRVSCISLMWIINDKVILLFILFSAYQFSVIDFNQVLHVVYFRALDLLLNIVTSLSLYHISRLILVVCPFVFFLLSVVLRYTDSDYPWCIFKLFLLKFYI
jgi:hypothetical protein